MFLLLFSFCASALRSEPIHMALLERFGRVENGTVATRRNHSSYRNVLENETKNFFSEDFPPYFCMLFPLLCSNSEQKLTMKPQEIIKILDVFNKTATAALKYNWTDFCESEPHFCPLTAKIPPYVRFTRSFFNKVTETYPGLKDALITLELPPLEDSESPEEMQKTVVVEFPYVEYLDTNPIFAYPNTFDILID